MQQRFLSQGEAGKDALITGRGLGLGSGPVPLTHHEMVGIQGESERSFRDTGVRGKIYVESIKLCRWHSREERIGETRKVP